MELLFYVGFHEVSFHFFLRIIDYKQSLLFSKVSCANKKEKMLLNILAQVASVLVGGINIGERLIGGKRVY